MTSTEQWTEKIEKLLRKAESTDIEAEAETLREKAYDLMAKFQIEQAEIDARRAAGESKSSEQIIEREMQFIGIFRFGLMVMAHHVVQSLESLSCFVVKDANVPVPKADGGVRWADAVRFFVVGYESDVKQALLLLHSLELQAASEMVTWWKRYSTERPNMARGLAFRSKREFFMSFGAGAGQKIRLSVRRAKAGASEGAALVLYDKAKAVDDYLKNAHDLTSRKSTMQGGTYAANQAGYAAGQRANTGDTGVVNTKRGELR